MVQDPQRIDLSLEPLEDRRMLAAIVWENEYQDDFEVTYGVNAAKARMVVEAAIQGQTGKLGNLARGWAFINAGPNARYGGTFSRSSRRFQVTVPGTRSVADKRPRVATTVRTPRFCRT